MGHEQAVRDLFFPIKPVSEFKLSTTFIPNNWIQRSAANSNLQVLSSKIFNMDLKFKFFKLHVDFFNTDLTPILEQQPLWFP